MKVVRIFPSRKACWRWFTALAVEQSEEWLIGRHYLNMEELKESRYSKEREEVFMKR